MRYDRSVLVEVLVYHQATATSGCHCGWRVLGASHAEHVADVYESSVAARTPEVCPTCGTDGRATPPREPYGVSRLCPDAWHLAPFGSTPREAANG